MVIFHSYVSLREGMRRSIFFCIRQTMRWVTRGGAENIFCRNFGAHFSGMATTKTGHSKIPWGYSLVN